MARRSKLNGAVWGYAFRVETHALVSLRVRDSLVISLNVFKFPCISEVLRHVFNRVKPLGIGMEEKLALGICDVGWRPADYWLHRAPFRPADPYDEFPFYGGPFHMPANATLTGIAVMSALRRHWPKLPATEAAPSDLYHHLSENPKPPSGEKEVRANLARWLGISVKKIPKLGKEFHSPDAAVAAATLAALAMFKGLTGQWTIDLHKLRRPGHAKGHTTWGPGGTEHTVRFKLPALGPENLIFPSGRVSFFWPPDPRRPNL